MTRFEDGGDDVDDDFEGATTPLDFPLSNHQNRLAQTIYYGGEVCPVCNIGSMKRRVNRGDHSHFAGCSLYPKCRYTGKWGGERVNQPQPLPPITPKVSSDLGSGLQELYRAGAKCGITPDQTDTLIVQVVQQCVGTALAAILVRGREGQQKDTPPPMEDKE